MRNSHGQTTNIPKQNDQNIRTLNNLTVLPLIMDKIKQYTNKFDKHTVNNTKIITHTYKVNEGNAPFKLLVTHKLSHHLTLNTN